MNTYRLRFNNYAITIDCSFNIAEITNLMLDEDGILAYKHYDGEPIIINISKVENITVKEDK